MNKQTFIEFLCFQGTELDYYIDCCFLNIECLSKYNYLALFLKCYCTD